MANCGLLLNDGTSFLLLNDGTSFLLLNDNTCATEPGEGAAAQEGGALSGNYLEWWDREWARIREERAERKRRKLPKKKRKVLDELDEILLELRARIDETPAEEVEPKLIADYRETERFYQSALNADISLKEMQSYLALALAIRQELDDEEAIILALH